MRILLLNPPAPDTGWYHLEHLGLGYIAAVLRGCGHEVCLLDSNLEGLNVDDTFSRASAFAPIDVIGLTAMEPLTFQAGLAVAEQLRAQGIGNKVVAGGYFASFWGKEVIERFPSVDVVVLGEGERTIVDLIDALERGSPLSEVAGILHREAGAVAVSPRRALVSDLDHLPFPERDYVRRSYAQHHVAGVYASRGCVHECTFCQIVRLYELSSGSPYRTRSGANIAAELESLVSNHGIHNFLFVDDEFIQGSPRRIRALREFVEVMRQTGLDIGFSIQYRADQGHQRDLLAALKSVGLTTVFIGVESGLESVLDRYDKKINRGMVERSLAVARELELMLIAGYILFDPYTTFDELQANVNYLTSEAAPTILDLHGMIILKGTPDESRLSQQGLLKEEGFQLYYRTHDPNMRAFKDLLGRYYPFSSPGVGNIYRLHLMIGRFASSERDAARLAVVEAQARLRVLHHAFLQKAMADVLGKRDGGDWLQELEDAHAELAADSARIIQEWEPILATR
jgi:radical SAM superfamily enzyme YgiQ (UPF0313 family)